MRQSEPREDQSSPSQPVQKPADFSARPQFRHRDYAEQREDYPDDERDR